jgi:hypothetical protein
MEGENMKKGIILYIAGDKPEGQNFDPRQMIARLNLAADRIEIVSRHTGHFDISDAWWRLIAKGMHQIWCVMAEFAPSGELSLTGRSLRLCG